MEGDTQGARIRALFENAEGGFSVIAPFIKIDALRSLIEVIPAGSHLRCVSRWLPREIAAGVSDPEILDLLEVRGSFSLSLVDRLHAKLYIAGDRCLAGSANITLAGLGEGGGCGNIETLVETAIDDPGIAATIEEIDRAERPATRNMAQAARRLADSLAASAPPTGSPAAPWFPGSRPPRTCIPVPHAATERIRRGCRSCSSCRLGELQSPAGPWRGRVSSCNSIPARRHPDRRDPS